MSRKRPVAAGAARGDRRHGSAMIEFSLVAVPLLFLIFFTVEFGRAIWSYHTLAGSVKTGTRYTIVHGERCTSASPSCQASVGDVISEIRVAGLGLDPARVGVTLNAGAAAYACTPIASCEGDATPWPPVGSNAIGLPVTVDAVYEFESVISSFWPGQQRAAFSLIASSQETIQF